MSAVSYLPIFLAGLASRDDDEVVGFTQNGGWQKVDILFYLLLAKSLDFYQKLWFPSVHRLSAALKVS